MKSRSKKIRDADLGKISGGATGNAAAIAKLNQLNQTSTSTTTTTKPVKST